MLLRHSAKEILIHFVFCFILNHSKNLNITSEVKLHINLYQLIKIVKIIQEYHQGNSCLNAGQDITYFSKCY
jgi:hypothetical protein